MASRKLVRDFFISKKPILHQFLPSHQLQHSNARLRLISANGYSSNRQFSVFNEFSNKIKNEASSNKEFQKSVKQLKEKAEELKEVKGDLKVKMKQTTEQLHKRVDGVWTEAEETAKKVSANMKEKISAAKEEVIETFGFRNQESSTGNGGDTQSGSSTKANNGADSKDGAKTSSDEEHQQSKTASTSDTLFSKFRSTFSSSSPTISSAFQKLKEAKVADLAKKSFEIVKDELSDKPNKRKRMQYTASSSPDGQFSDRTEVVVVPVKQSAWNKKWETLKEKMRGHPMFKRVSKMSEPVVTKTNELAEDLQERWETSDSPVVHKIQDINDKVFGENDTALSFKEIRQRDPSFSLPEFVAEVQDIVKPVLNAYLKGDFESLAKYCSTEVVERCKAERRGFETQGVFFDNKILHISEVDVSETKMMGNTPLIILYFQTQQIYCVRDKNGSITEGSKDSIQTVHYVWAMQQLDPEDVKEDAIYSMWILKDMQQLGVAALI